MAKQRRQVPTDTASEVMFASDSTCCHCNVRGKATQIHHIDEDPGNNSAMNLAVLCLECHNNTQIRGGFGRHLGADLVRKYRDDWIARVASRRTEADRVAGESIERQQDRTFDGPIKNIEYSDDRADASLLYVQSLPALRRSLRECARCAWETGSTSEIVEASYRYIDALRGILIYMAGFYPEGTFERTDPHRFFSEQLAARFRWHRSYAEPDGAGTGGTIVNIACSNNVLSDIEKMVEDMALTLVGFDDRLDWKGWSDEWRRDEA